MKETSEERLTRVIGEFDAHIKKTLELLDQSDARYDTHINKLSTMLEQSEARIDRTNEMIMMLAKSAAGLENTVTELIRYYNERIIKITDCRDSILKTLGEITSMHEKDRVMILELREEKDKILRQNFDRLLQIIDKNSSRPVINVDNNQN